MDKKQKSSALAWLNVIIFAAGMIGGGAEMMKSALKLGDSVKKLPKKGE